MSSYASIFVGGREVFSYRNDVRTEALALFSPSDFQRLEGPVAVPYAADWFPDDEIPDDLVVYLYRTSPRVMRDRLDVLGFGLALVQQVFDDLRAAEIAQWESYDADSFGGSPDFSVHVRDKLRSLHNLDFRSWQTSVADHLKAKLSVDQPARRDQGPFELFEAADERVLLRAILDQLDDDAAIELDVSDLVDDGWLDERGADKGAAYASWDRDSGPPILITEGTFDAEVLRAAIEILKPHLTDRIRFLDYEVGNEGGASAAVRMLKSFAAAGVNNRIVATFDNDSAAYEAVLGLTNSKLPPHYRVIHYPTLPLASAYPTLGPQGNVTMDVNGLAGSIELYLGRDVLTSPDGSLLPVQWRGYMGKIKRYQGEVVDKGAVQRAFRAKVDLARADPAAVSRQDWSGLQLLVDTLVETLSAF